MDIQNTWLTPFQRSYSDIKTTLINKLSQRAPEITDTSSGNIFMIIISIWAAIAEVIHYYIDNSARESFLITARRYSSVYKHAKMVDYHIKAANPSSVDIVLYVDTPIVNDIIIPANTEFIDNQGNTWISHKSVTWPSGTYSISIAVEEKQIFSSIPVELGTTYFEDITIPITNIPAGKYYVEGSMVLSIGLDTWTLVTTFAYSKPSDKHYKVEISEQQIPTIIFGDGIFGSKPPICQPVKGNFYITTGSDGSISTGQFNTVPSIVLDSISNVSIINNVASAGGSNYENFNQIKEHIPLSIKTLGVAITKDDYVSLSKLQSGVSKAYVNYICGRFVEIYITPENGGTASQALLDSVLANISKSKVLTTSIEVKSTQEIQVYIDATVTGKPSYNAIDINEQIVKALVDTYSFTNSDINKPIRLSDIYSLIDQLSLVDYLTINNLYFVPVIYPNVPSQPPMVISSYTQISYNSNSEYIKGIIVIDSISTYILYLQGQSFNGSFGTPLEVVQDDIVFSLNISNSNTFNIGDNYSINFQPMNQDLIPFNYTIPIMNLKNIKLNINATV